MRWAILFCLALAGCAGNASLVRELAKDQASVCLTVTTLYGRVQVARTKISNGNVSCTPDGGLTVKSDSVPLTVGIQAVTH